MSGGKIECASCGNPLRVPPRAQRVRCPICCVSTPIDVFRPSQGPVGTGTGDRFASKPGPGNAVRASPPEPASSGSAVLPGRKRALLCGVTYKNSRKHKLRGTASDVRKMKELLVRRFQFPEDSIRVLTEETMDQEMAPTKRNMERSLQWLVEDCRPGDSLVFYFSGHGLRQPDFNDDELDGFDETLCPSDFQTEGMILDDYINDTIVKPLTKDVKLHAIIDACHSGTVLDLEYVYDRTKNKWKDNKPPSGADKGTRGGLAICFSACTDSQLASDTDAFSKKPMGGTPRKTMGGALTSTLIEALEGDPPITYGYLLDWMHKAIERVNKRGCFKFRLLKKMFHRLLLQEPQLSSSEEFDIFREEFKLPEATRKFSLDLGCS